MEHQSTKHAKDSTPKSKGAGTVSEKKYVKHKFGWSDVLAMIVVGASTCWLVWMILDLMARKLG